jgi:hypothetical protein
MKTVVTAALAFAISGCASSTASPPLAGATASTQEPTHPSADELDASASACHGKPTPELVQSLTTRAAAARACYERALRSAPRMGGRMVLVVAIAEDGQVADVAVAQDETGSNSLHSCVAGVFRLARFPAPLGGCVRAVVPLSFVPLERPDAGSADAFAPG